MKKIGLQLLVVFLGINAGAFSQCCPYITSVEVLPQNPNSSDYIRIATLVATPNNGEFISHQFHWEDDTLVVEACYYSGLLTVVTPIYDTVDIGQVPEGDYGLKFIASTSIDENMCVPNDSQTYPDGFSVSEVVGLTPNKPGEFLLYPNPSKEWATITNVPEGATVLVYSLDGKRIDTPLSVSGTIISLDVRSLAAGFYEVVILRNGEIPSRSLLVKE